MWSRRFWYVSVAVLLMASLGVAACRPTPTPTQAPVAAGKLEIFSWWTAGGEAEGLNAMYKIFQAKYPGVEIINATVAGGAGSAAKAVLATRMQAGDPPDSFQVHAGHELIDSWVKAGKMEPVTFILGRGVPRPYLIGGKGSEPRGVP